MYVIKPNNDIPNHRRLGFISVVLIAEIFSAKRHSLIWLAEATFTNYGARSREPTIIRRSSIHQLHQRKKTPQKRAFLHVGGGGRSCSFSGDAPLRRY